MASKLHQGHLTGSRDIQNGWIHAGQPLYLFKACSAMGVAGNTKVQQDQEPVVDVQTHLLLKNVSQ
jgi:hypothetical protein